MFKVEESAEIQGTVKRWWRTGHENEWEEAFENTVKKTEGMESFYNLILKSQKSTLYSTERLEKASISLHYSHKFYQIQ